MTTHIAIARGEREVEGRTGPRAAFDAYMGTNIHTARATQAEIRSAGNKKQQFAAYCAKFGSQFSVVNGNGAVRSNEQVEEVRDNGLLSKVAKALGVSVEKLASIADAEPVSEPVEDEPIVATRISWPMAMALKKIATQTGQGFEITGKTGGKGTGELADYGVKFAGKKLNASQASALIGASKA